MLDKILQLYIGFCYLERLRTTPHYIQCLKKTLFTMIRKLGRPTFFITLTSAKRLWTP